MAGKKRAGGKNMFEASAEAAEATAGATRIEAHDHVLHAYPDYETYRRVQEDGNKAKIRAQYVKKSHIHFLADHLNAAFGTLTFGLCHGVRRGRETAWFRERLAGRPVLIGTDISETATQFPDTIQWDFHDANPAWSGRADFVYSNSWDHAFDPGRAFRAWADALRPGGLILLDHTTGHVPDTSNALDPFGATLDGLTRILTESCTDLGAVAAVLDRSADADYPARVVVFRRS